MIAATLNKPPSFKLDIIPSAYGDNMYYATTSFSGYTQPTAYDSSYDFTKPSLNETALEISQIYINNVLYVSKSNITECVNTPESFFMDISNQIVHIHYAFGLKPTTSTITTQNTIGYCDNKPFYDSNDFEYLPYIQSSLTVTESSDRITAGKMTFRKQSIRFANPDQHFNNLYEEAIPGALVTVKYISNKDLEEGKRTLTNLYSGYSSGDSLSTRDYVVTASDLREKYSKKIPTTFYTVEDNKVIPEGYGDCRGIEAICLNPDAAADGQYQYATDGTSLTTVYEQVDNNWVVVTPATTDPTNGKFTLTQTWTTGSPPKVKVDARLRDIDNPADIMLDIFERYYDLQFNSTNFEIEQWNEESLYFEPVYLCMNKDQETYKYLEELQDSSTYNFKLIPSPDGKFTIKVNDNNRAVSKVIDTFDNVDMIRKTNRDFKEYATTVTALYNEDHQGQSKRVRVDTYQQEALDIYQIDQDLEIKSKLVSLTDATEKADRIALEYKEVRNTVKLKLNELLPLQIYDIISVDNRFIEDGEIVNEYIGEKTGKILKLVYDFKNEKMEIEYLDITGI